MMIAKLTSTIGALCVAAVAASLTLASGATSQSGYVSLFNGKNLDGWVIENNARFSARDGLLVLDKGVGWLRTEKEYADFILKMDFRFLEKEANSGIFVRTKATSKKDENGWPDNGYQVQCKDTVTESPACATMIPYGAPPFEGESDLKQLAKVFHPTGEWNSYEIQCVGEELTVKLNGALITKAHNIKNLRGCVGIQAEHGLLEFRNIRIKVLGPAGAGSRGRR